MYTSGGHNQVILLESAQELTEKHRSRTTRQEIVRGIDCSNRHVFKNDEKSNKWDQCLLGCFAGIILKFVSISNSGSLETRIFSRSEHGQGIARCRLGSTSECASYCNCSSMSLFSR